MNEIERSRKISKLTWRMDIYNGYFDARFCRIISATRLMDKCFFSKICSTLRRTKSFATYLVKTNATTEPTRKPMYAAGKQDQPKA